MKVIKKSENGFKCEGTNWYQCDKFKLINSDLFKSLKVGDSIDSIKVNKDNFVTSFIILSQVVEAVGNPFNKHTSSSPTAFNIQDNIRYGQCVNIAFHCLGEIDLSFQDGFWIKKAFNHADLIYIEYTKRCKQ
jgi:hypothetical protein